MLAFGLLFLSVICISRTAVVENANSLAPPYILGSPNLENWELTGSAQLHGLYVRLTPDVEEKRGAVWNTAPCFMNNWELQARFQIHGKSAYLGGDGMAIWYVQEPEIPGSGPIFGSVDYFSGLGIFIDTFSNYDEPHKHRHPYISAVVNNGSLPYEHDEDGTMAQIGGCHVAIRNLEVPTRIAVSYINNDLAVYVDSEGLQQWKLCFKSKGVYLPTGYYFGVSASTSQASDNHDLQAITTLNLDGGDLNKEDRSDVIPRAENIQIPPKTLKKVVKKQEIIEESEKEDEKEEEEVDADADHEVEAEPEQEEIKTEDDDDDNTKEEVRPPTSLIRILIYLTGTVAIILISISAFKNYMERRRIRIEKRLY